MAAVMLSIGITAAAKDNIEYRQLVSGIISCRLWLC